MNDPNVIKMSELRGLERFVRLEKMRLLPMARLEAGGKPPSKEVCQGECGAKCCKSHFGVEMTYHEHERIEALAMEEGVALRWTFHHNRPRMHLDGRCGFLTDDDLCSIYEQRPLGCKQFPEDPYRGCLVYPGGPDDPEVK